MLGLAGGGTIAYWAVKHMFVQGMTADERKNMAGFGLATAIMLVASELRHRRYRNEDRQAFGSRAMMKHLMSFTVTVAFCLTLAFSAVTPGCAGLMSAIEQAASGALLVGDALGIAEQVEKDWFSGHPDAQAQKAVDDALQKAHDALAALQAAIDAAKKTGNGDGIGAAAGDVLKAYIEVKKLVDGLPPATVGQERVSKLPITSDVAKALGVSP